MRNGLLAWGAAAALALPFQALANDRHDRYGDRDRYHDGDRPRDRDGDRHDRDDHGYGDDHDRFDDEYGDGHDDDGYGDSGYDHDSGYDDYDDHGEVCPPSFDLVIAFAGHESGKHDRDGDGVVCCKVVHHGWQTALLCIEPDRGYDDHS